METPKKNKTVSSPGGSLTEWATPANVNIHSGVARFSGGLCPAAEKKKMTPAAYRGGGHLFECYKKKYRLNPKITNAYAVNMSNPTVQPDERTETGIPVPDTDNVEYSREYQQENKL